MIVEDNETAQILLREKCLETRKTLFPLRDAQYSPPIASKKLELAKRVARVGGNQG